MEPEAFLELSNKLRFSTLSKMLLSRKAGYILYFISVNLTMYLLDIFFKERKLCFG